MELNGGHVFRQLFHLAGNISGWEDEPQYMLVYPPNSWFMLPKSLVWRVQERQGDDDPSRTCGLGLAEFDMGGQSDRRVTVWSILMSNSSPVGFRLALMSRACSEVALNNPNHEMCSKNLTGDAEIHHRIYSETRCPHLSPACGRVSACVNDLIFRTTESWSMVGLSILINIFMNFCQLLVIPPGQFACRNKKCIISVYPWAETSFFKGQSLKMPAL